MCDQCDYKDLFKACHLHETPNRLSIMEIVGNSGHPLSVQDIFETFSRTKRINRVTVYRILELLVKKELVERISGGDRSFRYGIAPNANHSPHPHFYCKYCGTMECLNPESISMDIEFFERTFSGLIEKTEIRIDGICKNCLRLKQKNTQIILKSSDTKRCLSDTGAEKLNKGFEL